MSDEWNEYEEKIHDIVESYDKHLQHWRDEWKGEFDKHLQTRHQLQRAYEAECLFLCISCILCVIIVYLCVREC